MNPVLCILLCAGIAGWTWWLMRNGMKVNQDLLIRASDPHVAIVETFKELNDRMLLMVREGADRQEQMLDRLFSAADRIGTPPAPQITHERVGDNGNGHARPQRQRVERDDDEEADEALDAEIKRAQKAERRRTLEDNGVLGADPATV